MKPKVSRTSGYDDKSLECVLNVMLKDQSVRVTSLKDGVSFRDAKSHIFGYQKSLLHNKYKWDKTDKILSETL